MLFFFKNWSIFSILFSSASFAPKFLSVNSHNLEKQHAVIIYIHSSLIIITLFHSRPSVYTNLIQIMSAFDEYGTNFPLTKKHYTRSMIRKLRPPSFLQTKDQSETLSTRHSNNHSRKTIKKGISLIKNIDNSPTVEQVSPNNQSETLNQKAKMHQGIHKLSIKSLTEIHSKLRPFPINKVNTHKKQKEEGILSESTVALYYRSGQYSNKINLQLSSRGQKNTDSKIRELEILTAYKKKYVRPFSAEARYLLQKEQYQHKDEVNFLKGSLIDELRCFMEKPKEENKCRNNGPRIKECHFEYFSRPNIDPKKKFF